MSSGDEAEAMVRRVLATARTQRIDSDGTQRIERALRSVLEIRKHAFPPSSFELLHGARTQLILMLDAHVADATVLCAACLVDSRHPQLATSAAAGCDDEPARRLADEAQRALTTEESLEALLVASEDARAIALAEMLDQVRHLHLMPEPEWTRTHARACGELLPLAARSHPAFERRFAWWCRMFEGRYLTGDAP